MDYFNDAFGGFRPQSDPDAALKFSLHELVADDRLDDLAAMLSPDGGTDGVEGEPGWIIEKRGPHDAWPPDAAFRAFVDPEAYSLAHPQYFCDRATFARYADAILAAVTSRDPVKARHADLVRTALNGA